MRLAGRKRKTARSSYSPHSVTLIRQVLLIGIPLHWVYVLQETPSADTCTCRSSRPVKLFMRDLQTVGMTNLRYFMMLPFEGSKTKSITANHRAILNNSSISDLDSFPDRYIGTNTNVGANLNFWTNVGIWPNNCTFSNFDTVFNYTVSLN